MVYKHDIYRCKVDGKEQIMTRSEYETLRREARRAYKPFTVEFGPKCGERFDNIPEPEPQKRPYNRANYKGKIN